MGGTSDAPGARNAGLYLLELLLTERTYRDRWTVYSDRLRSGKVNNLAVAKVVASYVADNPTATRGYETEAKDIKDTVANALKGRRLSQETLTLFIQAFAMTDEHARSLQMQWDGDSPLVVVGMLEPPEKIPNYPKPRHEIVMLHEHHWLGASGLPFRHQSQIMLRARVDGLRSYRYIFDTPQAVVRVEDGGSVGEIAQVREGLWGVTIRFPPLDHGQTHYFNFSTELTYDAAAPPPTEIRRASHVRTGNVDVRLRFHRDKLPSSIWWAEWAHYEGPNNRVYRREPYQLDSDLSVHKYLNSIERAVVGFYWDW